MGWTEPKALIVYCLVFVLHYSLFLLTGGFLTVQYCIMYSIAVDIFFKHNHVPTFVIVPLELKYVIKLKYFSHNAITKLVQFLSKPVY